MISAEKKSFGIFGCRNNDQNLKLLQISHISATIVGNEMQRLFQSTLSDDLALAKTKSFKIIVGNIIKKASFMSGNLIKFLVGRVECINLT